MKKELWPPKCTICGKFISYKDFEQDKITADYTPDTELSIEETEFTHDECIKTKKP